MDTASSLPAEALSPTQREVASALLHAAAHVPVIHLTGDSGFIANGKGTTTILRNLAQTLPSAALVDVSAGRQSETAGGGSPALQGYDAFVAACMKAWESARVLLVDDIDLAAHPESIYSVRLGATGESFGFYQTAAEPTLAVKLLAAHAVANDKVLVFRSVEDHFLRFIGQPFTVQFPAFSADDYMYFLQKWLPKDESAHLGRGGAEAIWRQYPQLSAADLRVACVPSLVGASGTPMELERSSEEGPPAVLARIADRLAVSQGSVSLAKIDKKELTTMPGLGNVMKQIERHVLLPFEHPEVAAQFEAEPKHGVLLYGPPGTGKTSIGRALAHRLKGKMFMVKELNLHRELMVTFAAAEANAPSVVFIDDMDAVMQRDMVSYGHQSDVFRFLLAKLDGLASKQADRKHVVVIMACNNLKMLPEPLLRSGRIELWLKTELPKLQVRKEILTLYLSGQGDDLLAAADLTKVAKACDDFTPADLKRVVMDSRNLLAAEHLERCARPVSSDAADSTTGREGTSAQAATAAMLAAVDELKQMKAEVEYMISGMYS